MISILVEKLTDDAQVILAFIKSHPGVEAKNIALNLGMNIDRLDDGLSRLYFWKLIDALYEWEDPIEAHNSRLATTRYVSRV